LRESYCSSSGVREGATTRIFSGVGTA